LPPLFTPLIFERTGSTMGRQNSFGIATGIRLRRAAIRGLARGHAISPEIPATIFGQKFPALPRWGLRLQAITFQ